MATSQLITGRGISRFDLNSLIFLLSFGEFIFPTLPSHGNDIS